MSDTNNPPPRPLPLPAQRGEGRGEGQPAVYKPSYEELQKMIEQAPMTWLPALFTTIVKRCLTGNVFQPRAMARYCRQEEAKYL